MRILRLPNTGRRKILPILRQAVEIKLRKNIGEGAGLLPKFTGNQAKTNYFPRNMILNQPLLEAVQESEFRLASCLSTGYQ